MAHRILLCSYAQFQISDGTAGNAAAQANAVFVGENFSLEFITTHMLLTAFRVICRPFQERRLVDHRLHHDRQFEHDA